MGRVYLALDLGTTTGWARGALGDDEAGDDWNVVYGSLDLKPGRYSGGGMRFVRFENALDEMAASAPFERVYFEEVRRHQGVDAAHVYGGLMATLTAWCEKRSIPYEGVPVGTIKKAWTGKGNAPKAAMIDAAEAMGYTVADDNQADALALLHWAIENG